MHSLILSPQSYSGLEFAPGGNTGTGYPTQSSLGYNWVLAIRFTNPTLMASLE